jgi:hypothetical protein
MSARPGPCGGQSAMVVPTAISLTKAASRPKQALTLRTPFAALDCWRVESYLAGHLPSNFHQKTDSSDSALRHIGHFDPVLPANFLHRIHQ